MSRILARAALLSAVTALGCGKSEAPPAPPLAQATLAVDIRQSVDVTLSNATPVGASGAIDALDVDLKFAALGDYAFFDAAQAFHARGRVEAFPEAAASMITARFALPARASSACGGAPMSAALALMRRGTNARVGGGLTVYCGADTWSGVPARVLRITGELPLSGP